MRALTFLSASIFRVLIFLFDNGIWLADGKILPTYLVPNQAVSWAVGLCPTFDNDFCFYSPVSFDFTLYRLRQT